MSAPTQNPQERAFYCVHCNGRIVIPADLPPTTGPCPHCKGTITSPAPESSSASIPTNPVASSPQPAQAATVVLATKTAPATPVSYEAPEELKQKEEEYSKKSPKKSSALPLLIIFIIILAALGGGGYYVMNMMKKDGEAEKPLVFKQSAKQTANPTLEQFLSASTLDDKLNHVYNAEALRPKVEAFYRDKPIIDSDTPADKFTLVKVPEADSKNGFNLLNYDQPATGPNAGSATPHTKILAFLKETEQGVKLDWEVFVQTKYQTLSHFLKTPTVGKTEVFRVIVTKDPASKTAGYLFTDPIHHTDSIQIAPDPTSPAGKALASLDQESAKTAGPVKRTATIELTWAGDPRKPQLQINRFICWEFLGLGGKDGAGIPPSK
jgi:hypothetical protein